MKIGQQVQRQRAGQYALRQASQAAQAKVATEDLYEDSYRAQQHAIDFATFDDRGEVVDARANHLRQPKTDRHHARQQRYLAHMPAEQGGKTHEEQQHGDKLESSNEEVGRDIQNKVRYI